MLSLLLLLQPFAASSQTVPLHFPAADPTLIARLIGPPPQPPAAGRDLAAVLEMQDHRTAADCATARIDAELAIFEPFAGILGAGVDAAADPATTRLIGALVEDGFTVTATAKSLYNRRRPNALDPAIKPCIDQPATSAYPSGHGVFIYIAAEAFAELVPERRDAFFARADSFAWNRIVGGIHFPADATAARTAAALYYAQAHTDPAFAPAIAAARAELRRRMRLP